jgi:2-iminobutanoate/2-iminopropanoate deaminase
MIGTIATRGDACMFVRMLAVIGFVAALPVIAGDADRAYVVNARPANLGTLPFSDAVLSGSILFVGGHLGLDPATGLAPADPKVEARLVMDAVRHTVEKAGLRMDDLVSVTVYCTDLELYATFNAVYATYFHGKYPARAFIGAAKLLRNSRFEVTGVATRPRG